jgi:Rrf2 family protein
MGADGGLAEMKIRTRARYSLRMMMTIAKLSDNGDTVGLGEVANHCGISRRYLEQLVSALRNASLVRAVPGRGGGYALARDADRIKVREIIEAAIGPIAIADCLGETEDCLQSDFCSCQALWKLINYRITSVLDEYTLADIMAPDWRQRILREIPAAL